MLIAIGAALLVCALVALRSKRPLSKSVGVFLVALIPPVVGNAVIILAGTEFASLVGMYLYYIGMDAIVVTLLLFTSRYCSIDFKRSVWFKLVLAFVAVDVIQIALNPLTGATFTVQEIDVQGAPYFALVPLTGQKFHRVVAYGIFLISLGTFIYKCITATRIYLERYAVILISMIVAAGWQTFYIFSGTPVDHSMIGFGVFGLLVFYFALFFKPFRVLDRMLSRIVSGMPAAMFFFEVDGACIYANAQARAFLGLGSGDIDSSEVYRRLNETIGQWDHRRDSDWEERRCVGAGEDARYYEMSNQLIKDERAETVGTALSVRDVTETEIRLARERHLATHDALTGLYNQTRLFERTREILDEDPDESYVVVGLDIKDFKIVNDIFGKEVGDGVICAVAEATRAAATHASNTAYGRIGGDKFGFIARAQDFDAAATEDELRAFSFEGMDVNHPIVIHMGVYEVAEPDLAIPVMYDRAFMALSSVKHDLNRRVSFYDNEMRESVLWNQSISSQLEGAIADGQIRPYLQPMVDANGSIEGAEVLVRWIHPEEGFLSPARFVPVFEENGMIAQLDVHMWECACRILRDWQERGLDLFLSVNISPKDFYFIDVYATIRDLVEKYGINPAKLRLEITETVMMTDLENRLRIIEDLRSHGFLVEMDDFGSGYSSLNMLKDIPVDVLKIDMMFLYKTKNQAKAQTILETIINLSRALGIPSVTEGVETAEQLNMLVSMGCSMFQGYYFAKPMPLADFEELAASA